jgi:primosomal protein N' (replication factor Y)
VDVVFDRPLDHPFTYAVGDALRDQVAIGKRLRVPFGRGDKSIIGYCVGVSQEAPARAVKEVLAVLDEESLLTEPLLRLTRWMADYYLCGWGQVLNAVVPAGARELAGSRATTLVRAVDASALPERAGALSWRRSPRRSAPPRQVNCRPSNPR